MGFTADNINPFSHYLFLESLGFKSANEDFVSYAKELQDYTTLYNITIDRYSDDYHIKVVGLLTSGEYPQLLMDEPIENFTMMTDREVSDYLDEKLTKYTDKSISPILPDSPYFPRDMVLEYQFDVDTVYYKPDWWLEEHPDYVYPEFPDTDIPIDALMGNGLSIDDLPN